MSNHTVLVVDDETLNCELISFYLEETGYTVESFTDSRKAWARIESGGNDFSAILLDRMMPGIDGIEILKRIKADNSLQWLPVILQTAVGGADQIREGIAAGAYYYLTKPIDGNLLKTIVASAIADTTQLREIRSELEQQKAALAQLDLAEMRFRTLDQAGRQAAILASACPDPERVAMGLAELMINAVEHGNLEITYAEKSELVGHENWLEEVDRRLADARYGTRWAKVRFERANEMITISIRDEGPGFDPSAFLSFDPSRAFDSHGRGIAMAKAMSFDSLAYTEGGRCVTATVDL